MPYFIGWKGVVSYPVIKMRNKKSGRILAALTVNPPNGYIATRIRYGYDRRGCLPARSRYGEGREKIDDFYRV
jgi:hypothetical protein